MLVVSAVMKSQGQQFLPPLTFDTCTERALEVLRLGATLSIVEERSRPSRWMLHARLV